MTRLLGAALLLPLAGLTSAASGPAWRPNVFDRATCASFEASEDARGTGLQRSEVAGVYLLDEHLFTHAFVEARLLTGTPALPEYPMPEFPSRWAVENADLDELEALTAKREAARHVASRHALEAFQRAGPLLRLEANGTWSMQRADDGTRVAGGRYALHADQVWMLDVLDPTWTAEGPRPLWLRAQGRSLEAAPDQWLRHRWPERAPRRWRREGDELQPPPPALEMPDNLPPQAFAGAWRLEPASLRACVEGMVASFASMRSIFDDVPELPRKQEQTLTALRSFLGSDLDIAGLLSECWRLDATGAFQQEGWTTGAWQTSHCGRWQVLGPCVVHFSVPVHDGPPQLRAAVLVDGELRESISHGEHVARYRRVSR